MPNNLKLEFKNNIPDLSKGLDAALSWLTPFNLPPDASYVTILAIEELATHAINHGYPDNLEHIIHVEITVEKNQLVIQYLDVAPPCHKPVIPVVTFLTPLTSNSKN